MGPPKGKSAADKREELRDGLWPDADDMVWDRKAEKGFCTIPRTLPLLMSLIGRLSPKNKGDASRVYLELWTRAFDEGFVEIVDEEAHAFACGYETPGRGVRSWRERMDVLEELGFIRVKPRGSRKHGYVLLIHPHKVVESLREKRPGEIPEGWYSSFLERMVAIGAAPKKVLSKGAAERG